MRSAPRLLRLRRRLRDAAGAIGAAAIAVAAAVGGLVWLDNSPGGRFLFIISAGAVTWLAARAAQRERLAERRQRRSEARLDRRRALFQNTLENLGEGLSVFSRSGRLIAWNARFCELVDLPSDLVAAASLRDLIVQLAVRGDFGEVDPEAEAEQRIERFFSNVPTVSEHTMSRGRILRISRRAMPNGAVVSVYSDITELKAFERQLVEARKQAEAANHSKSEFLANMSHELRTPLNAIIGFSEIIANQIFGPIKNEKYLEYLTDIHSSSLHLLSIINDILDMSKIEAGRLELAHEAVSLQSTARDAMRMMHERARDRGLELRAEFAAENIVVWADARAIKQVFLNLISNAIKFSNNGNIYVRISLDQNGVSVIEVEDFGIGMTAEEQERALQPFGQARSATTREYGGTGLGLPITEGLVAAHGGTLAIDSRVNVGTKVRVTLPVDPDWIASAETPPARSVRQ